MAGCLNGPPLSFDVRGPSRRMPRIEKAEIVGTRIIRIHQTYEITDGGNECCQVYFSADRGFSFTMPFVGVPWETSDVPLTAKPFGIGLFSSARRIERQIRKRKIAGVYCCPEEPDSAFLVLDDGSQLHNNLVAPYGTGGAGLYYIALGEAKPLNKMVDFFDVPLDPEYAG
jgi:hypothetical protein